MKALVLTVSDRASRGEYEDRSGPAVESALTAGMPGLAVSRQIVSDEPAEIRAAFLANLDKDFIITSGGTGIGPRDKCPDVTEAFCDSQVPGIAEYLRRESCRQTVNAVFSRGRAGVKGRTLIVNLPGSQKGAQYCAELLAGILPHAHKMLHGGGH